MGMKTYKAQAVELQNSLQVAEAGSMLETDILASFIESQESRMVVAVSPILVAIRDGFTPDPGTSDLDNEQPIHITIPLGEYRRAVRLLHELEKT